MRGAVQVAKEAAIQRNANADSSEETPEEADEKIIPSEKISLREASSFEDEESPDSEAEITLPKYLAATLIPCNL